MEFEPDATPSIDELHLRYRRLVFERSPSRGGGPDARSELIEAMDAAMKETKEKGPLESRV